MHAHPSFGTTTTKTLRSVFSWCASCMAQELYSGLGTVNGELGILQITVALLTLPFQVASGWQDDTRATRQFAYVWAYWGAWMAGVVCFVIPPSHPSSSCKCYCCLCVISKRSPCNLERQIECHKSYCGLDGIWQDFLLSISTFSVLHCKWIFIPVSPPICC